MKIVDANVPLYVVNSATEHHRPSRRWLDTELSGADTVGLAWVSLLAFVRLTTKVGLFPAPLTPEEATQQVNAWLSAPGAVLANPTPRHAAMIAGLLAGVGTGGNLVSDAHLAALAIEHRGAIVSYDNNFGRFDGITWLTPRDLL